MKLHIVPARTGLLWVKRGFQTFMRQPLALSGLFFVFMALMALVGLLPWIGSALVLGLLPAATLGFMAAAKESSNGQFPSPWILASALRAGRQELRAIALLGAIYALAFLTLMAISSSVDGGQFARFYLAGEKLTREQINQGDFQNAMWLVLALNLPLSLLFWHAPALVHWYGVPPIKALFFSLVACVRNLGAYTVFGLAWLGIFLTAMLLVMLVLGSLAGPDIAAAAMMPLASLFMALFFTSLYFTFADSFITPPAPNPSPSDSNSNSPI